MPKAFRWKHGLVILLLPALLAGCFQQAGESFQPASSTALPLENTPLPLTDVQPDDTAPPGDDETGGADVQVIVPEAGGAQILATPTALPITVFMQPTQSQMTQAASGANSAPGDTTGLETATPSQLFITPGSPLMSGLETATPPGLQPVGPTGLVTPTAFSPINQPGTSADDSGSASAAVSGECAYTVRPGDNLYRIAVNNGTTLAAMRQANPDLVGDAPILQPGQVLRLPDCASDSAAVPPTAAPATGPAVPTVPAAPGEQQVYRIQPGDTLYGIALRFNTTIGAIQRVNNLPNPDRLDVGQEIIIPAD